MVFVKSGKKIVHIPYQCMVHFEDSASSEGPAKYKITANTQWSDVPYAV